LLTILPPAPSRDGEEARAMLRRLPFQASSATCGLSEAALAGRLVQDVGDPRASLGWDDYAAVGKEITREQVQRSGASVAAR
jgi:chromosome partitioning protein